MFAKVISLQILLVIRHRDWQVGFKYGFTLNLSVDDVKLLRAFELYCTLFINDFKIFVCCANNCGWCDDDDEETADCAAVARWNIIMNSNAISTLLVFEFKSIFSGIPFVIRQFFLYFLPLLLCVWQQQFILKLWGKQRN